jgi:hypothetical protein
VLPAHPLSAAAVPSLIPGRHTLSHTLLPHPARLTRTCFCARSLTVSGNSAMRSPSTACPPGAAAAAAATGAAAAAAAAAPLLLPLVSSSSGAGAARLRPRPLALAAARAAALARAALPVRPDSCTASNVSARVTLGWGWGWVWGVGCGVWGVGCGVLTPRHALPQPHPRGPSWPHHFTSTYTLPPPGRVRRKSMREAAPFLPPAAAAAFAGASTT